MRIEHLASVPTDVGYPTDVQQAARGKNKNGAGQQSAGEVFSVVFGSLFFIFILRHVDHACVHPQKAVKGTMYLRVS